MKYTPKQEQINICKQYRNAIEPRSLSFVAGILTQNIHQLLILADKIKFFRNNKTYLLEVLILNDDVSLNNIRNYIQMLGTNRNQPDLAHQALAVLDQLAKLRIGQVGVEWLEMTSPEIQYIVVRNITELQERIDLADGKRSQLSFNNHKEISRQELNQGLRMVPSNHSEAKEHSPVASKSKRPNL